jgi:hypothetical protein
MGGTEVVKATNTRKTVGTRASAAGVASVVTGCANVRKGIKVNWTRSDASVS